MRPPNYQPIDRPEHWSVVKQEPAPARESAIGWRRMSARYRAFVVPRADGLPTLRVLLSFLILLGLVGVILIALGINGTSSGAYFSSVSSGKDPQLLAGHPEKIRSDEWNVGVPWTLSQVQRGLPTISGAFPGGADADIPFGLPTREIFTIIEPQNIGFLFLDAGRAYAFKWWLPALALIGAAFALMVTLLPRRPLVAVALSIGFFFSPFFQWWFEPASQWPVAWGALTIAAIVWALRSTSLPARIALAVIAGYLTAVMAIGLYAPFIIPVVYVVLFAGIGLVISAKRSGLRWRTTGIRLVPIALAGVAGGGIVLLWLRSKATVVATFLNTVYPGQRLTPTGAHDYLAAARTIGSSFSESLQNEAGFLGINSSEASTFFLFGIFLLPLAIGIVVQRRRQHRELPWRTIGLFAFVLLVLAFIFVPGWNGVAHVLFLDLSNGTRMRIGLGLASFALVGSIASDLAEEPAAPRRRIALIAVAIFALSQVSIALAVAAVQGPARLWQGSPLWIVFLALSCAAIYLVGTRRIALGAVAFLVLSICSSATVNPTYVGVFDLRTTAISRAIVHANSQHPKSWVGVGGSLENALLLESGVTAFNGTQGAPSRVMWREVDPTEKYINEWNRLGAVDWVVGHGSPVVSNPAEDTIQTTFDACSAFAQKHVGYVLSNVLLTSPCVQLKSRISLAHSTLSIYSVVERVD
jgi:hypothetical protein